VEARGRLAIVGVVLALLLAPGAAARTSSAALRIVDLGKGAAEAWVILPEAPPSCIVAFVHAPGDTTPAKYLPWLDYLVLGKKCAVVFPRYQAAASGPAPAADLRGLRQGMGAGIAFVRKTTFGIGGARAAASLPVVAAGVGYGGTLALHYAADARGWGLPVPAAVDSVFPVAGATVGLPSGLVAPSTRVLIQVGDRDRVGGKTSADYLWSYLASHPAGNKHLQVVRSTGALQAVQGAPLKTTAAAENAFWPPLDALIDTATG
jgi:hypothetical protein